MHAFRVTICWLSVGLAGLAAAPHACAVDSAAPLRALLLSGSNNHDWRKTTPRIKAILESTGRFQVDIHTQPGRLNADALAHYDLVLSNWNSWGTDDDEAKRWSPAVRQAYLDFVANGGGHVVVHAGSSSFFEWEEYHQLTLATWKLGKTSHGPRRWITVRIDSLDHPIVAGMADFEFFGELWERPGVQEDATVLASAYADPRQQRSGRHEPVAFAKRFGEGRSFTLLLGHAVDEMRNRGFTSLLTRGSEWAATGDVTLAIAEDLSDPEIRHARRTRDE